VTALSLLFRVADDSEQMSNRKRLDITIALQLDKCDVQEYHHHDNSLRFHRDSKKDMIFMDHAREKMHR